MLKLQKFIFSNKNMFGLGFASVIIVLALIGFLKAFWMPIMCIAYILGYMIGPQEKQLKFYHFKGESLTDYIGFLQRLKNRTSESQKLPEDAKKIIYSIHDNGVELITFLQQKENFDDLSEEIVNLKAIFDAYLPKLINEYERLPVKYATQVKTSNGKMAKDMLIEQLTLLDKKITEVCYGMYEDDVTTLKINGRFLKEKFEKAQLLNFEMEMNS